MTLLRNALKISKAIIFIGFLAACQNEKDAMVSPVKEQAHQASFQNAKISANSKLIKDGFRTFSYSGPRQRLWKEYFIDVSYYKEYIYSDNMITANRYTTGISNTKINGTETYQLNAKGLCIQSNTYDEINKKYTTTIYEYNDKDQLIKAFNKFRPNERQEYDYPKVVDSNWQWLYTVCFYDKYNNKTKDITYHGGTGALDLYPLNPDYVASISGKYLPIFGKFCAPYLPVMTMENQFFTIRNSWIRCVYEYTFFPDGRVKTERIADYDQPALTWYFSERKYSFLW